MSQNFNLDKKEKKVSHTQDAKRISSGMIRTLWDYSERKPSQIFLVIDTKNNTYKAAFTVFDQLVEPQDLPKLKAKYVFKDDPERLAKLDEYFSSDIEELKNTLTLAFNSIPPIIEIFADTEEDSTRTMFVVQEGINKTLLERVKALKDSPPLNTGIVDF